MITREQVADLQPGDVVELALPGPTTIRGPLVAYGLTGDLGISAAGWCIRDNRGRVAPPLSGQEATLTVVSRAPRPLYVNHPRTEPYMNDVVCDAEDDSPPTVWLCDPSGDWWTSHDGTVRMYERDQLPKRLRLLVDGETGQVVP